MNSIVLNPKLGAYVHRAQACFSKIPSQRASFFEKAAQSVSELAGSATNKTHLLFVCTHNSRRSQFGQAWATVAASVNGLSSMSCHSCGTEETACHPNTIAALNRAGFSLEATQPQADNPCYFTTIEANSKQDADATGAGLRLFSKAFGHSELPTANVVAMMCCEDASEKCPVVPGAVLNVPLHYRDPKRSDGSAEESATYDASCLEIATEMLFFASRLAFVAGS